MTILLSLIEDQGYTLFGVEWQGWYFVFRTVQVGRRAGAYLYHTIGLAATSSIRALGVPCSHYIDHRHVGQLAVSITRRLFYLLLDLTKLAEAAVFICAAVLVSLGYFLGLSKSTLIDIPSRIAKFHRFLVSSELCSFILQVNNKEFRSITWTRLIQPDSVY